MRQHKWALFSFQVSEAIKIGAQVIKENKITVEEVHVDLQELDENITAQKQVNEALGILFFYLYNVLLLYSRIYNIFCFGSKLQWHIIHFIQYVQTLKNIVWKENMICIWSLIEKDDICILLSIFVLYSKFRLLLLQKLCHFNSRILRMKTLKRSSRN